MLDVNVNDFYYSVVSRGLSHVSRLMNRVIMSRRLERLLTREWVALNFGWVESWVSHLHFWHDSWVVSREWVDYSSEKNEKNESTPSFKHTTPHHTAPHRTAAPRIPLIVPIWVQIQQCKIFSVKFIHCRIFFQKSLYCTTELQKILQCEKNYHNFH